MTHPKVNTYHIYSVLYSLHGFTNSEFLSLMFWSTDCFASKLTDKFRIGETMGWIAYRNWKPFKKSNHTSGKEEEQNLTRSAHCACVDCTFTVDNEINHAKYNGRYLEITGGARSNWQFEKVISFQSCSDSYPGILEIKGKHNQAKITKLVSFWYVQSFVTLCNMTKRIHKKEIEC